MRAAVFVLAIALAGCPGAILLSAVARSSQHGFVHPPNAKDYESWANTPVLDLETHSQFSLLPRETRPLSDGSELRVLRYCPPKFKGVPTTDDCCFYQFVLRGPKVASYRTAGACMVDCSMRPESKVQACINDAAVPTDYH